MKYDTLPSSVGSYLKLNEVYEVLELFRRHDPQVVKEKVIRDNVLDYNTTDRRRRVLWAVKRSFLSFRSNWRERLFLETIESLEEAAKREVLFYRLCRRSFTTYRLTLDVLLPAYEAGKDYFEKTEILEFLKTKQQTTKSAGEWTENTVENVGSKYLTTMKKFGYLSGRQKKEINYFSPELKSVTYAVYELLDRGKSPKEIINSDRLKLFMLKQRDVLNYLERIGNAGYISFGQAGDVLEISPTTTFRELPDAF